MRFIKIPTSQVKCGCYSHQSGYQGTYSYVQKIIEIMLKKSLLFPQIIKTFLKYPHTIVSHVLTDKANGRLCVNFPSLVQQSEVFYGLLWFLIGKESACRCKRHGFNPWVGKILWRRKWPPTLVFLPGKSREQRSLGNNKQSMGVAKELDMSQRLNNNKSVLCPSVLVEMS